METETILVETALLNFHRETAETSAEMRAIGLLSFPPMPGAIGSTIRHIAVVPHIGIARLQIDLAVQHVGTHSPSVRPVPDNSLAAKAEICRASGPEKVQGAQIAPREPASATEAAADVTVRPSEAAPTVSEVEIFLAAVEAIAMPLAEEREDTTVPMRGTAAIEERRVLGPGVVEASVAGAVVGADRGAMNSTSLE